MPQHPQHCLALNTELAAFTFLVIHHHPEERGEERRGVWSRRRRERGGDKERREERKKISQCGRREKERSYSSNHSPLCGLSREKEG